MDFLEKAITLYNNSFFIINFFLISFFIMYFLKYRSDLKNNSLKNLDDSLETKIIINNVKYFLKLENSIKNKLYLYLKV